MTSWQGRAAEVLVALGVLPGLACLRAALALTDNDPGFLFAVLPVVICALLVAGVVLVAASLVLVARLRTGAQGARLQALALGATGSACGLFLAAAHPIGWLLVVHGVALSWLVVVADDLGEWVAKPPAPWGSTPGTGTWSAEPQVQGPRSPPPTSLPWLPSRTPTTPWWQTWEAGLAQGIPLGDLLVLVASAGLWLLGILAVFSSSSRAEAVLLLLPAFAGVWWVERRLRARLQRG